MLQIKLVCKSVFITLRFITMIEQGCSFQCLNLAAPHFVTDCGISLMTFDPEGCFALLI